MPRAATQQQTFQEIMQQVLQSLAVAEIAPDAPPGAVDQIRKSIIGMMQGGQQQGMQMQAPPGGMPVQQAGVSRGPTPGMDTQGMSQDLSSLLMGQGQPGPNAQGPSGPPMKPGQ
jgi:hypothetical protein